MSISDALSYPFRNDNLFKILPIAIVYGIILFFMSYATTNGVMFLVCGASFAMLIFSFVLGGYYISVIEQVHQGEERLQDVMISRDLSRGVATWLAGILYMLPLALFGCMASFLASMILSSDANGGGLSIPVALIVAALVIPLVMFLSLALAIGYNRYAAEGNTRGLYSLTENLGIAWQNAGQGLGLIMRTIVIGLINFAAVFLVQIAIGLIFPQQLAFNARPTTTYWIGYALIQVVTYTVSLIFIVSQYHLIARYGMSLGITSEKRKSDEVSRSLSPWILVVLIVGLLFIVPVLVIMILALFGPAIGDVFSEINSQLLQTPMPR
jgi:hypothetical protein